MNRYIQSPRTPLKWILTTIVLLLSVNSAFAFWAPTDRVSETVYDSGTAMGDPITASWSIVPDGTTVPSSFVPDGVPLVSDFIARLDTLFSVAPADQIADLTQRPWFTSLENSLAIFTSKTGITYLYEPNDDGSVVVPAGSGGILGVRGDLRFSGIEFKPNTALGYTSVGGSYHGQIVYNTVDTYTWNANNLKGICSHENMHATGFSHFYINGSRTLSTVGHYNVNGPQFGDLLGLHRKYGDKYEKSGGNDTVAEATVLGTVSVGTSLGVGLDAPDGGSFVSLSEVLTDWVSIDDNGDTDVYQFTVAQGQELQVKVSPRGFDTYNWDVSTGTHDPGRYSITPKVNSDLSFRLLNSVGSQIQSVSQTGLGSAESLMTNLGAGDYYVEVKGSSTKGDSIHTLTPTQFYALEIIDLTLAADDLTLTVVENGSGDVTLSGSGAGSLSYTVADSPTHGVLSGTAPDLTYTPTTDYVGTDSFTYYVSAGGSDSAPATVTLNVIEAPVFIATAASVGTTGYHATGDEATAFRSTGISKTFDSDGDDAYGTAGYYFYGNGVSNTSNADGKPSWVTAVGSSGVTLVTAAGYVDFNNPTLPISDAVADWTTTTIGLVNTTGTTGGLWAELLTFTVDASAPRRFRLGVMAGNEVTSDGRWDPAALRLSFDGDAAVEASDLEVTALGMVFFDVTLADAVSGPFSIEGQNRSLGSNTRGPSIAGISFDYASPLDAWLATYPTVGNTSFDGDPDEDGIETGLEYVLNGDPTQSGDVILPELDAAGENLIFTFTRRVTSAADTTQVFQYSSTLQPGDWTDLSITDPQAIEVTIGTEVDGLQSVTVTINKNLAEEDSLFGRLKVQHDE